MFQLVHVSPKMDPDKVRLALGAVGLWNLLLVGLNYGEG